MYPRAASGVESVEILLLDSAGYPLGKLNFTALGLDPRMTIGLRDAFSLEYGHTLPYSQVTCFSHCRKFAAFLCDSGLEKVLPLRPQVLHMFRLWLEQQRLSSNSRAEILNVAIRLLSSLHRNFHDLVSESLDIDVRPFPRDPVTRQKRLTEQEIKSILKVCREEIDEIENRLIDRVILPENNRWSYPGHDELIAELLELGGGVFPRRRQMKNSLWTRVAQRGGLRSLTRLLWVTLPDLLPFYLLVLIQSAGNPDSILAISRDCIVPHPLRGDLEWLEWFKARSASTQRAEFPVKSRWSATGVVRRLLILTDNLSPWVQPRDRGHLFIGMTAGRRAVTPERCHLHLLLRAFRAKHPLLPDFQRRVFRGSSSELHRQVATRLLATGELTKDIVMSDGLESAQAVLNHKRKETVLSYVDVDKVEDTWQTIIHRAQQGLDDEFTTRRIGQQQKPPGARPRAKAHQTVFGFLCKGPFDGIAPGTKVGELCDHFLHCSSCPGSFVPLDNISVVARLVSAKRALRQAEARAICEGWKDRFDVLYRSTLRTIEENLLAHVPESIVKDAEEIAASFPVPYLE